MHPSGILRGIFFLYALLENLVQHIYYSVNIGSGWSESAPVNEHPAIDGSPDIAVDGEGRVWCVWSSNRDDHPGIWASYTRPSGVEEDVIHQPALTVEKRIGSSFIFRVSNLNSPAQISIYDASGRNVRNLELNTETVTWDGSDVQGEMLSSGVYFVRVNTPDFTANERIILLR